MDEADVFIDSWQICVASQAVEKAVIRKRSGVCELAECLVAPELHQNDHCCITCVTSLTMATLPYPVAKVTMR